MIEPQTTPEGVIEAYNNAVSIGMWREVARIAREFPDVIEPYLDKQRKAAITKESLEGSTDV